MKILALETSGLVASAAVMAEGCIISEELLDGQLTHSQIAMPMLERVLCAAQLDIEEIDVFAVNVGPGSFTGLRIGISSINAIAFATQKKVVPVNSLEALAISVPYFDGLVCPIIDARNDQVYAGMYDTSSGFPQEKAKVFAGSIGEFVAALPDDVRIIFTGDGTQIQNAVLKSAKLKEALFMPPHLSRHRASNLAVFAEHSALLGNTLDSVQPLYLRIPQAQRLREQKLAAENGGERL